MSLNPIQNNLILELHVPDFSPTKDFYGKLGFEIIHEDIRGNYPGYLVMKRRDTMGNTILNFYGDDERVYEQAYFQKFPRETVRGYAVEITFPTSNIKIYYEKVRSVLSENIVRELKEIKDDNTVWCDFRMIDPYGFYIRVTELINWGQ